MTVDGTRRPVIYVHWSKLEDEQLIDLTIRYGRAFQEILRHWGGTRTEDAIRSRQTYLRMKGKLKYNTKAMKIHNMNAKKHEEARMLAVSLSDHWTKLGYTTHEFWPDFTPNGGYVVRSNLINGKPPPVGFECDSLSHGVTVKSVVQVQAAPDAEKKEGINDDHIFRHKDVRD